LIAVFFERGLRGRRLKMKRDKMAYLVDVIAVSHDETAS